MKKVLSLILILCVLTAMTVSFAYAQSTDQLKLGLNRDFGYGGFGNDIQGLFSAKISNPPTNVTRVVFYIDTTSMGEDTTPPFSLQFNTDSYPLGTHTISAIGYTSDSTEIDSNKIQVQFVPASAGTQVMFKILVPVIGLIFLMALFAVFLPLVLNRGKLASIPLGAPRKYGIGGGAICPKCKRPFQLRLWWINLGMSKIDRCPYCGKWSLVRPRSLNDLRDAEAAELSQAQSGTTIGGETEAEKLKKDLDDSRFQNT
jgi:hypothetical protein